MGCATDGIERGQQISSVVGVSGVDDGDGITVGDERPVDVRAGDHVDGVGDSLDLHDALPGTMVWPIMAMASMSNSGTSPGSGRNFQMGCRSGCACGSVRVRRPRTRGSRCLLRASG